MEGKGGDKKFEFNCKKLRERILEPYFLFATVYTEKNNGARASFLAAGGVWWPRLNARACCSHRRLTSLRWPLSRDSPQRHPPPPPAPNTTSPRSIVRLTYSLPTLRHHLADHPHSANSFEGVCASTGWLIGWSVARASPEQFLDRIRVIP